ncbi:hypothetical protein LX15_002835 [Streptoalloteichus tenebrarius]|uniref:Uncharacterized protein n=1 Tax=Streptoalloteichus tenebrarius (strain ATCC 17920 / DSM 40477 / JCM 4838 / CBS 697.72 / NBRC 16177 / NCIMB 11028 / NRRL B-12390 / A12253. 1 / ISP 5477) TaxID=1933 RepID=A0ABT1HUE0_STRSD|nr:hypothetical protein [Streptoalloteichus tenebrarius]MCP2259134.1 hypothetical protein [Streptoalloteichus tenebrarius]BFF04390.1 hypothetical protein GCM10020241_60650 [Streptoalloteichus tenebrarius]
MSGDEQDLDAWGAPEVLARIERLVAEYGGWVEREGRAWHVRPPDPGLPEILVEFGRMVVVMVDDIGHEDFYPDAFEFDETAEMTWVEAMVVAGLEGGWYRVHGYTADGVLVERHAEIDAPGWKVRAGSLYMHPDPALHSQVAREEFEQLPAWPRRW